MEDISDTALVRAHVSMHRANIRAAAMDGLGMAWLPMLEPGRKLITGDVQVVVSGVMK